MQATNSSFAMLAGPPPSEFRYSFEPDLYQQREYLFYQKCPPNYSFYLIDHQRLTIDGLIHFYRQQHEAISQLYAPFGSFQGHSGSEQMGQYVVDFFESSLVAAGIESIVIHHPASFYRTDAWDSVFRSAGYSVHERINHHILVGNHPLDKKLHQMEKRKLAKSSTFRFSLYPLSAFQEIYEFIAYCRHQKGQMLSMTFSELQKVVAALPERFMLCAVHVDGTMAAASVVVKVNASCWYQFYPAHSKEFNRESPLVYLTSELYNLAASQGVKKIDLGTSEVDGNPIEGLLLFKDRMGAVRSFQNTYTKNLQ